MALTKLNFTKDWNNPADFPTVEVSEAAVRADMQDLWDQTKVGVNKIATELESTTGANQVGAVAPSGVTGTTVQTILDGLKEVVNNTGDTAHDELTDHTTRTDNPHSVTKAQIGLGNVDNTSDANKPISTATQAALDLKENIADANNLLKSVVYNSEDGTLTFTKQGGATVVIDTNLERVPGSMALVEDPIGSGTFYLNIYDTSTPPKLLSRCPVSTLFNEITVDETSTITLYINSNADGTKTVTGDVRDNSIVWDKLGSLVQSRITTLENAGYVNGAVDSSTIDFTVSNHTVTGSIKSGAITGDLLEDGLYDDIVENAGKAETSASNAAASEANAGAYSDSALTSANASATSASSSLSSATLSESYAKGGTGVRPSENTDNSKYYKEQSASSASASYESALQSASSAKTSESWAVGGTGTRQGEDQNNAEYWARQAAIAAGGGVQSFNGRDGFVAPQAGDYTADMVGLGNVNNTSDIDKPVSTAVQTELDGLQDQIDAITSSSDVVDIVGTHAELEAYDTSTLGNNDIVKVLQDETQDNAITYYRWLVSSTTWDYIGSQGPFYTKAEADQKFNDTITASTDLVAKTINAGLVYTTTVPTAANANGLKIVVLSSEPATKYNGWLYIITG